MIHDLVIRLIAEYLREDNQTLVNLQCLNARFYSIRHMFIKQIDLNSDQSQYAYNNKPCGWNKVRKMGFYYSNISDVSALGSCHTLTIWNCENIRDVSALGSCHTLTIEYCPDISDVLALNLKT